MHDETHIVVNIIARVYNIASMHYTNTRFPLFHFRSALHCGYSGITDIQDGLFFVLTRARTFKKS